MPRISIVLLIVIFILLLSGGLFAYLWKDSIFGSGCYSLNKNVVHTGVFVNSKKYEFEPGVWVLDIEGCLDNVIVKENGDYELTVGFVDSWLRVKRYTFKTENGKDLMLCTGPDCNLIDKLENFERFLIVDKKVKLTVVIQSDIADYGYNSFMTKFVNSLETKKDFPGEKYTIQVLGLGN